MNEIDHEGMKRRANTIRAKYVMGLPLTNHELMAMQMEQYGFGCPSCGGPNVLQTQQIADN